MQPARKDAPPKLATVPRKVLFVEGSAGGGMVTVRVSGKLELQAVHIDPTLLESPDREMLQDLMVAAVNDGIRRAQALVAEEMGKLTGGLGLKLPGLG